MRGVLQRDARAARERLRLGKALVAAVCAVLLAASTAGCSFGDVADDADSPSTGFSEGASDERVTEQGEPAAPDTEGETPDSAGTVGAEKVSARNAHAEKYGWVSLPDERFWPSGYFAYSVRVMNPNEAFDLTDVALVISSLDKEGALLYEQEQVVPYIAAGDSVMVGGCAGQELVRDEWGNIVEGAFGYWREFSIRSSTPVPAQGFVPHAESFTLSEVRADVTRATPHSYSGYVTINGGVFDACDKVMITATLEDDNIIVAGYSAVIDKPANGVATYFKIPAEGIPEHNSYYLDVIPWE